MEALEVEGQTDQPPLTDGGLLPTQGELAEAEHVLDHSNDRFDSAFADAIDGFAHGSLKLVSHLHLGTGIFRRRIGKPCEALFPTRVMGITTSFNVGANATLGTGIQGCGTKEPRIQSTSRWVADGRPNRPKVRFGFMPFIRVIR